MRGGNIPRHGGPNLPFVGDLWLECRSQVVSQGACSQVAHIEHLQPQAVIELAAELAAHAMGG